MDDIPAQELEGRLNAHRELLISLLSAGLTGGPEGSGSSATTAGGLRDDVVFKDGEEDPGVIPDEAFAIENAMAREMRTIIEAARARAAAAKPQP